MNGSVELAITEQYYKEVFAIAISKDGVLLDVCKIIDTSSLDKTVSHFAIGNGGYIPAAVVAAIGDGNVEQGLSRLTEAVAELDYENAQAADADPLYQHIIYPLFGGEEAYNNRMAA